MKKATIIILISILLIGHNFFIRHCHGAEEKIETEIKTPSSSEYVSPARFLISLTPPVIGYSSVEGVRYDYLPLSFEAAIYERIGLRIVPSLIYYESELQSYDVLVFVPFYFGHGDGLRPYGGFYVGPLAAAMVDRLPTSRSAVRGGFEAGYAWSVTNTMQFSLGYWHVFKALDFEPGGAGLTISLGRWF